MDIVLSCDSNSVCNLNNLVNSIMANNKDAKIYLLTDNNVNVCWAHKIAIVDLPNINCIYRWGKYMYLKLYIDVYFPELEKVIYLDYDTIVLSPLDELIEGDFVLRAVKTGNTFNSGVMAINMKKCDFSRCREMITDHTHDEALINDVFGDSVEFISNEWNSVPYSDNFAENPKIIHYMGWSKPWDMAKYVKPYLKYE